MVETAEGIEKIDEITSTPGVDAVYIGPTDLALSLGLPPVMDNDEPKHIATVNRILEACKRTQIVPGIHTASSKFTQRYLDQGFQMVMLGTDRGFMANFAKAEVGTPHRLDPDDAGRAGHGRLLSDRAMDALLFSPLTIRGLTLRNRIVLSPMLTYSATNGYTNDTHLAHLAKFAVGGAGLVMVESTKIDPRGCSTPRDLGLWKDEFIPGMRRIVDLVKSYGAACGIQLGHSGRKARRSVPWEGRVPLRELSGRRSRRALGADRPERHRPRGEATSPRAR